MRFVPAEALQPGMVIGRDIINRNRAHMLCRGVTLTPEYVSYIRNNGFLGAYILDSISEEIIIDEVIDQKLFEKGIEVVENENIGGIISVATQIVAEIINKKNISIDLFDLRSYDDYTYHHSVNVAVYATVVGKRLGLKESDLDQLCAAGIAHDLGKSKIPIEILNKPGKLTDEEFAEIKNHPKYSYEMLQDSYEVSSLIRAAVLMHHENENGTGYPLGKQGEEIPLFAKIIHAVDVYDALTSKRPYKDPFSPADAFEYMNGGAGILFDPLVVNAMIQSIPAYPPGIDIQLSNGEKAIVVSHTRDAVRPRVKIIRTGELIDMSLNEDYRGVKIVNSGIMPQDYAGEIEQLNEERQSVKTQKTQIMIVDDEKRSQSLVRNSIKGDYDFLLMNSGMEAVNYISANGAPDLVIVDIEMPIMSGITTGRNIRNKGIDVPIIFMSDTANVDNILECKSFGNMDFILRPANPVYINERVEVALGHSTES